MQLLTPLSRLISSSLLSCSPLLSVLPNNICISHLPWQPAEATTCPQVDYTGSLPDWMTDKTHWRLKFTHIQVMNIIIGTLSGIMISHTQRHWSPSLHGTGELQQFDFVNAKKIEELSWLFSSHTSTTFLNELFDSLRFTVCSKKRILKERPSSDQKVMGGWRAGADSTDLSAIRCTVKSSHSLHSTNTYTAVFTVIHMCILYFN